MLILAIQPLDTASSLIPDHSATYELYDRVINVREGFSVPLGLRGTVIGISPGQSVHSTALLV